VGASKDAGTDAAGVALPTDIESLVEWYINIVVYRNPHMCMY
jgi:hypothetical protein